MKNLLVLLAMMCTGYGQVPAGFTLTELASGLSRPANLQALPDGRFLIGEQQTGHIKVYKNGSILSTPYAIISPLYTVNNESGLLGLCLDPDFSSNGYVYAFVTHDSTTSRVWRFTTSGDVGIDQTLIVDNIPHRGVNHNGGGIGFGPDGKLYMAVGEAGDTSWAQDVNILGGKILRANPDGSVPADNPFGNLVWSLGHRHPFRLTFQPGTGRLYVTENGPSQDDELNRIIQGGNFGWPSDTGPNANPNHIDPVHNFSSIVVPTDLLFYQGSAMPFDGELFLMEYLNARIRRFTLSLDGDSVISGPTDFVTGVSQPVDIEQGIDGALYFTTLPGRLYRVQSVGATTPTTLVANFMNGNTNFFKSRVYLWNPSNSTGNVTVRVFTLPLMDGLAEELTNTPLFLGTLDAGSALNLRLEDILDQLLPPGPYVTDNGNLTLELTIGTTNVKGAAQVFNNSLTLALGTYPLQAVPSTSTGSPTVLAANFLNGNTDFFRSRIYLFNPSASDGDVTVRVYTLPRTGDLAQELTTSPHPLGTLAARSALNIRLEDILDDLLPPGPYVTDAGNLTLEFTIGAPDVIGAAQVFNNSLTLAFGTYPLQ